MGNGDGGSQEQVVAEGLSQAQRHMGELVEVSSVKGSSSNRTGRLPDVVRSACANSGFDHNMSAKRTEQHYLEGRLVWQRPDVDHLRGGEDDTIHGTSSVTPWHGPSGHAGPSNAARALGDSPP